MLWQAVGHGMVLFRIKLMRVLKMQCNAHAANWLLVRAPSNVMSVTALFQKIAAKRFLEFDSAFHANPPLKKRRFIQAVLIVVAARIAN